MSLCLQGIERASPLAGKRTWISFCRSAIFSSGSAYLALQAEEMCISFKSCVTFSLGGSKAQTGEGEARA